MYALTLVSVMSLTALALAKDCRAGLYQDECVSFFSNSNCGGSGYEGSYVPTCEGNCYRWDAGFGSISAKGNQIYGTNCVAYYDNDCKMPMGETGNQVGQACHDFSVGGGGHSMKCYFDC